MRIKLTVILLFVAAWAPVCNAQSIMQRKTDSVFALVKKYFNAKQADSIYSLAGLAFRKELSPETFRYVAQNQLFPVGDIKDSSLLSFVNDKIATYKLTFDSGMLQLQMSLDDKDKLELFYFSVYKKDPGEKAALAATTNLMRTQLDKKVDSAARKYIQKANTVGLSIGILKDGVVSTYNYGETERGNKKLPDANTLFEIGSITKTFTATLLAYYVDEHKVKLTDPIVKFLPDSVAANKQLQGITLEMLSNHTSGLPRLPDNYVNHASVPQDPYKDYDKQNLFEYLKTCKLVTRPGEQYAYSNLGVGILGMILTQVSGKTFEQMVEQVICHPLGMQSTVQTVTPALQKRFAKVYNEDGQETPPWHFNVLAPCGALHSTVNNMLAYARANMTPAPTAVSKALQLTHQVTYTQKDLKLGLGWHIIIINNVQYYFHDGGTYGSSSFLVFNPQKKLAVIVLSNCGTSVNELGADIVKRIQ
ncbi:MAG TPA: serine hydrolase domain-containing protein [Mucilaginibacter sp.]|nr:serine hydrolase domain-containing protein [Mucilaginibacter sp.]